MAEENAAGANVMRRFLIVRLGALGDVVHAIPVAAALHRAFPSAQIEWLVSARHQAILEYLPLLHRRLVVNDVKRARRTGGGGPAVNPAVDATQPLSLREAIAAIRRERYDVAFDLQGLLKSAVIARLSGAGRVVGFDRKYARESMARFFYDNVHRPGGEGIYAPTETRHVVTINLGMLREIGIGSPAIEFPLVVPHSAVAAGMSAAAGSAYALLNTGAAWPNKRWPPERLAELARRLRERRGLMSVVLWGPGEKELAERVIAGANGAALMTPPTAIGDLLALARGASVVVSGDTGPTHIAAAVGAPIVGIYGPTRPERNGPWRPGDETVSRASVCQCHHLRQCRLERMCLLDIAVDEVLAAVERRLDAGIASHE